MELADLALADVDGDGRADVIACDAAGVRGGDGGAVSDQPCLAVAAGDGVIAGVSADGTVWTRAMEPGRLGPTVVVGTVPIDLAAGVRVAVVGGRLAVVAVGGTEVIEWSERGSSRFSAAGPVSDLAAWDGRFAWTVADRGLVMDPAGAAFPVAPNATQLAALDRGRLAVLHGTDRLGVYEDGAERITALSSPAVALATGDVDGDGCFDVAIATDTGVQVLPGTCAAGPSPDVAGGGGELPPRPRGLHLSACTAMAGVAMGGTYATSWDAVGENPFTPSVSPAVALACDVAGPLGLFAGLDSAVTFKYQAGDNVEGSHVLGASGGFMFGPDQFRIGPVGTLGTVLIGAGARAVWLPFGKDGQTRKGFEARVLALGPSPGPVPSFEAMLLYGVQLRELR